MARRISKMATRDFTPAAEKFTLYFDADTSELKEKNKYYQLIVGKYDIYSMFCLRQTLNSFNVKYFLLKSGDSPEISVPLAYVFGRIGNFLNQELFGRITNVPWGIYVDGVLRHPSQLYEAFLEGIVVFIIVYLARFKQSFQGELILVYAGAYSLARFICEFYREPDFGIGFVLWGMSMGQILSFIMFITALLVYICIKFKKVNI